MSLLHQICIVIFIVECFVILPSLGRSCKSPKMYTLNSMKFDVKHKEMIEGSPDNIALVLTVNWTTTGDEGTDFEGFLVALMDPKKRITLPPTADCQASNSHLWIKTSNISECGPKTETTPNCSVTTAPGEPIYCPCDIRTGPALADVRCTGSTSMMKYQRLGGYFSVPKTRRSMKYQIDFNTHYTLLLRPYYRQYTTFRAVSVTIKANWFCAKDVSAAHGLSLSKAGEKCCESGALTLPPTDFRKSELVLDKKTNTLNLTLSWIPPSRNEFLNDVFMIARVNNESLSKRGYEPSMTEYITQGSIESNRTCAKDSRRQISTVYNMVPNNEYVISIASYYSGMYQEMCGLGKCGFVERVRTDFDPCDEKWSDCEAGEKCVVRHVAEEVTVPKTSCVPGDKDSGITIPSISQNTAFDSGDAVTSFSNPGKDTTKKTNVLSEVTKLQGNPVKEKTQVFLEELHSNLRPGTDLCKSVPIYCHFHAVCDFDTVTLKTSCSCKEGMVGDGISKSYNGSGCSGCPSQSDCDPMAVCVSDDSSSSEAYMCRCDEHYYGDGMKSGTGCSSHAKRTAIIAVPVVIFGLIILAVVLWCICSSRRLKRRRLNNISL